MSRLRSDLEASLRAERNETSLDLATPVLTPVRVPTRTDQLIKVTLVRPHLAVGVQL